MSTGGADVLAMLATVIVTITLAAYSTRRARTTSDFYVAARAVQPWWNASAISGEYLSAASFLGVAGLVMLGGADALWFPVGYAVGYVLLLALVAAPLRRSGAYTVPDFAEVRFSSTKVRLAASILVVLIGWLYLVPQLQGAGLALGILVGTPMWVGGAVVAVTVLMVLVSGGMRSVTVVQGFQYWLKLFAIAVPVLFLIGVWRSDGAPSAVANARPEFPSATTVTISSDVALEFPSSSVVTAEGKVDGSPASGTLTLAAGSHQIAAGTRLRFPAGAQVPHPQGVPALSGEQWAYPQNGGRDHPLYRDVALMLALFLGTMGLPHILVRFYTNPDGRSARRTAVGVIALVGLFYLSPTVYGALGRLYAPELIVTGQTDAAVLILPRAMISGQPGLLLGALVAAGAAAAFLATATGLAVAVAGVLSQDIVRRRVTNPVRSFRLASIAAIAVPLLLGLWMTKLPLASAVSLAFAVAATTFAPLLVLGIWWRRFTDVGAIAALICGGVLSLGAIAMSTLGHPSGGWTNALLSQPTAWVLPLVVLTAVGVSLATSRRVRPDVWRAMVRLHTPEALALQRHLGSGRRDDRTR